MLLHLLFLVPVIHGFDTAHRNEFIRCMSKHSSSSSSGNTYSPDSPVSYFNLLQSAQHNPRWIYSTSSRPKLVVTPYHDDQIKATLICANKQGLQMRVMSGGHDYEGLSYRSDSPFVLIDLINLRSIKIELEHETAWVQAGATLGELYYSIAQKSNVHGFPAGICPSVGVGGHFSGGGIGTMMRKHGIAADNIIDARFMNSEGKVLDRESMGEDLFWALRGGGAASFGVVLAWKIKLVRVPALVTFFKIRKNLDEEGMQVVDKWQNIASHLPEDLFTQLLLSKRPGNSSKIVANFNSLFLGNVKKLLPLVNTRFPELGLKETECMEMSWINSTLYASLNGGKPLEFLLDRGVPSNALLFKGKSDFVQKPLPKAAFRGIKERLVREGGFPIVIMDPLGGKMGRIGESELPFPHRKGNLFNVLYQFQWSRGEEAKKHLDSINELYEFMKPYVSSSPRAAFFNYKDLDIGFNHNENTSYQEAAIWGIKYFKGNFERLARVKKAVDPNNFFRDEQSIPPIS